MDISYWDTKTILPIDYWKIILQKVNINDIPIDHTERQSFQEIYWTDDENNNMLLVVTLSNHSFIRTEQLYMITEYGEKILKKQFQMSSTIFVVTLNSDEPKYESEPMEKIKSYITFPKTRISYKFIDKSLNPIRTRYYLDFFLNNLGSTRPNESSKNKLVIYPQILNILDSKINIRPEYKFVDYDDLNR